MRTHLTVLAAALALTACGAVSPGPTAAAFVVHGSSSPDSLPLTFTARGGAQATSRPNGSVTTDPLYGPTQAFTVTLPTPSGPERHFADYFNSACTVKLSREARVIDFLRTGTAPDGQTLSSSEVGTTSDGAVVERYTLFVYSAAPVTLSGTADCSLQGVTEHWIVTFALDRGWTPLWVIRRLNVGAQTADSSIRSLPKDARWVPVALKP